MKISYIPVLRNGRRVILIAPDVIGYLVQLDRLGKITQKVLRHLVCRNSRGEVTFADLLKALGTIKGLTPCSVEELIEHQEKAARYWMVDTMLRATKGSVQKTAELINTPVRTLRRWMRELGLDKKSYRPKKKPRRRKRSPKKTI